MNAGEHEEGSLLPPAEPAAPAPPTWAPPPVAPPPAPPDSLWSRVAAFVVLIAVVAAAAGAGIGWSLARAINTERQAAQSTSQPESPITQVTPGTSGNNNNSSTGSSTDTVAAKVVPAIVDINTTLGNGQAAGTGMLISSNGEILTNNHVVTGSTSITVTVQGRSQNYTAHVIGVNVSQDVAVIQIDQNVSGLPTVTFADSSAVQVGDPVVAIGNALGQGGAPAQDGHVTALNQTITASEGRQSSETLKGMIQSDATIYEGDSGGALVNTSGQVVGMITAGEATGFQSASSQVGYAISSNTAVQQANRIRAREQADDLTYGQVGYLGVSVRDSASGGALVVGVQNGSPAANAGISSGSVITQLGGTSISSSEELGTAIKAHRAGDTVTIKWTTQGGAQRSASVTLGGVNP